MGVYFKGFCEHLYRFKVWKGAGREVSAFSQQRPRATRLQANGHSGPRSRFRLFRLWPIIQAAPTAKHGQPSPATENVGVRRSMCLTPVVMLARPVGPVVKRGIGRDLPQARGKPTRLSRVNCNLWLVTFLAPDS